MKKNKLMGLTVSSVLALSLVAGGAYAWFVSQKVSAAGMIETGTVRLCKLPPLEGSVNNLPGETINISEDVGIPFQNVGTRDAIVRVSFKDSKAHLAQGKSPKTGFENDYVWDSSENLYYYTPERLDAVIEDIVADDTDFGRGLYRIDNDYFFFLEAGGAAGYLSFDMVISGELGGGVKDPQDPSSFTPLRNFEQGTVFEIAYEAYAVQNTEGALYDVFTPDVYNRFPTELQQHVIIQKP